MPDSGAGTGAKPGFFFEDLAVGQSARMERMVDDALIRQFTALSGDDNPVHLDEEYARKTRFGGRIAQGMLGATFISAVIGSRLPGHGTIYLSQSLKFLSPVKIGDVVVTEATVAELRPEKSRAVLRTICRVGDRVTIEGEALVMVPKRG
ncbi:MAG TPA: MaoC family dehydratase [Stellaceae bacterium]|nr:MaoC family dehydratase [Stellaceae bacterium]